MKYEINRSAMVLSVEELCRLAHRSGDIGGRRSAYNTENAVPGFSPCPLPPSELKKSAGLACQADAAITHTMLFGGICYEVFGTVSGIFGTGDDTVVEVIKRAFGYEMAAPPSEESLSRLTCYAYFVCAERELPFVRARLTYLNPESGRERHFDRRITAEEGKIAYQALLASVETWAVLERIRATQVLPSLKHAVFPYSAVRDGQQELMTEAYETIRRHRRLFAQAPTGTGKTISVLYPAVRALGAGLCDKIFYLTAKSSTGREAYHAVGKLFEAGAKLRVVMLGAKEQVCLCEKAKAAKGQGRNFCNPEDCEYARGYYDRVGSAILSLLSRQNGYGLSVLSETAQAFCVCPYELSLDLSEFCDVVVCDYNYLFSPSVYLRRYFSPSAVPGNYLFLIDEAHNLPSRARNMYSCEISAGELRRGMERMDPADDARLFDAFDQYLTALTALRRLCRDTLVREEDGSESGFYLSRDPLHRFSAETENFAKACEGWLRENREHPLYGEIAGVYASVKEYRMVLGYYDDKFLTYVMIWHGDVRVRLYCLDPSDILNRCMRKGVASILFSATFTPLDYFTDVLGGGKLADTLTLPTPFRQENLFVAAVDSVSTRFEDRNEKTYRRIATMIAASVSARPGNYMVYFPSYSFMEEVRKCFEKKYPAVRLIVQRRGMGRMEKEAFLSAFKEDEGRLRIGFCVLGGSFSEGVDLPGKQLIGTVVVGVGLPGISNENNIIKEYYDIKSECGYDYAYTYPGMNQVLQAAGRVIRRDSDCGIVVLIDDRYADPKYQALFPPQWSHMVFTGNAASLAKAVGDFWRSVDGQAKVEKQK